jgi:hypothetical protein
MPAGSPANSAQFDAAGLRPCDVSKRRRTILALERTVMGISLTEVGTTEANLCIID